MGYGIARGGEGLVASLQLHALIRGHPDIHPTKVGQYLNALTFYAMLFGESPVGAAQPSCEFTCFGNDWLDEPPGSMQPPLAPNVLQALQRAAEGAVRQCGELCWPRDAVNRSEAQV
mmetsp:Transcript_49097/g.157980  ORF Transcript_49097/g.157980 Transcript_49097/m.157980 type:complete len:117 (-) Transcript_49097:17-367(-)